MSLNNADYSQSVNGPELGWYVDDIGYDRLTNRQLNPIQSFDSSIFNTYDGQGNRSFTNPEDYLEVRNYFGPSSSVLPATHNIINSRSEAERRHDYFESRNIGRIGKGDDPALFDRNLLRGEPTNWDRRDPNQFARQMEKERNYMNNRQINMAPDYSSVRKWGNLVNPRDLSEREKYQEREWSNKENSMATASQAYLNHRGETDTLISPYINKPTQQKNIINVSTQNMSYKENGDLFAKESFQKKNEKVSPYQFVVTEFNQKFQTELEQPHYFIKNADINELRHQMINEQIKKLDLYLNAKKYTPSEKKIERDKLIYILNEKLDLYFDNPQGYKSKEQFIRNMINEEIKSLNIEFNEILKSFKPKNEIKKSFHIDQSNKKSTEIDIPTYKEKNIKEKETYDLENKNIPITELENKIKRLKEIKNRISELVIENNNKQINEIDIKIKNLEKITQKQNFTLSTPDSKSIQNEIQKFKIIKNNKLKENEIIFNNNQKNIEEFNIVAKKLKKEKDQGKYDLNYVERLELINKQKPINEIKSKPTDKYDLNIFKNNEIMENSKKDLPTKKRVTLIGNTNVIL